MITAEHIRKTYPNAIPFGRRNRKRFAHDEYCVGGAVCRFFSLYESFNFPSIATIAFWLSVCNPDLSYNNSYYLAGKIMLVNDDGNIEKAWHLVDEALSFTREVKSDNVVTRAESDVS